MATTTSTGLPVTERHRTLALHHANLIQERKNVEAQSKDEFVILLFYV